MKIKLEWSIVLFAIQREDFTTNPRIQIFSIERQQERAYTYSKKRKFCCIAIFKNSKYLTLEEYEAYRRTL